jgi:hypothetical protein
MRHYLSDKMHTSYELHPNFKGKILIPWVRHTERDSTFHMRDNMAARHHKPANAVVNEKRRVI